MRRSTPRAPGPTSARRPGREALDRAADGLRRIRDRGRGRRPRRVRLRQGLERGGVPRPEDDPDRVRHQQRRPLHRGFATHRRWWRFSKGSARARSPPRSPRAPTRTWSSSSARTRPRTTPSRPPSSSRRRRRRPSSSWTRARTASPRHARHMLQFQPGTDVALLNALINVIVTEGALRPAVRRGPDRGLREPSPSHRAVHPGGDGPGMRHRPRHHPHRGPHLRQRREGDHLLGNGDLPEHPRDRQRALPHRACHDHRARGPARDRAASASRAEQRAGRVGRRPHPDGLSGLPGGGRGGHPRPLRGCVGHQPRPRAGPHRGRDHARDPRRRDQGHVHHGGESRDVRPRHAARPARPSQSSSTSWCRTSS